MDSGFLLRDIFSLKSDALFVCTFSTKSTFLCCCKGVCDGAGAVIIASESALKKHSLTPLARIVAYHSSGCDPSIMGIGKLQENAFSFIALSRVRLFFCWAFQGVCAVPDLQCQHQTTIPAPLFPPLFILSVSKSRKQVWSHLKQTNKKRTDFLLKFALDSHYCLIMSCFAEEILALSTPFIIYSIA